MFELNRNTKKSYQANLEYLRELSGGDKQFMSEIIQMFIQDAPDIMRKAQMEFKNRNYDLLRARVHKLKSSIQILGNNQLTDLILIIEDYAADQNKAEQIPPHIMKLNRGVNELIKNLKLELQKFQ